MEMNLKKLLSEWALALVLASCAGPAQDVVVKPITGTWVNLAWKDVRNKYTNPVDVDMTCPALWRAKVGEWHDMGLEYLILMEVANEGKAYYPSSLMPHIYSEEGESPVSAILDEAGRLGMKVLLSTGWAENQDDDLRRPEIRERQQQIMQELAALYGDSPAFWGWYLPVEDCITPVFPRTAVEAVNTLVGQARALTPGKKTLISPYGMVFADYDNPEFAANIRALQVDIIAYQDEVGCVREPFPLPRLREHWKKLRQVHEGSGIEMWANCETFTWEGNTNDRTSALIPAAYARLLAQQAAASEGGVSRIVSFMFDGIIEYPDSPYRLGQGEASVTLWRDYMAWKGGDPYWKHAEAALRGTLCGIQDLHCTDGRLLDGTLAEERPDDSAWSVYTPGHHAISVTLPSGNAPGRIGLRALDYAPEGILPPECISVYGADGSLLARQPFTPFANNRHDAWVDYIDIPLTPAETPSLTLEFDTDHAVYLDELYVFNR